MRKLPYHDQNEPGPPDASSDGSSRLSGARDSRSKARIVIGALIAAAVVLLIVAAGFAASSPRLCNVCHEMQPAVASWEVSPHAEVGCQSCHGTPRPWYGAPLSVVEQWTSLGRDMRTHWAGGASVETTGSSVATAALVPDSTCTRCHDLSRQVTSRYGLVINHQEHAKKNNSCTSCHAWTAHPSQGGAPATIMMAQCFTCHGKSSVPKASGECAACHVKDVDLKPDSHKTGDWLTLHGKVAKSDRQQCVMCHREDFCNTCHGIEMPHPLGWARGQSGHAVVARQNRAVCAKCHKGNTNLCTMCHHQGFDDKQGSWVSQHSKMVEQTGASFCFKCHDATYCVRCHTSAPAAAGGSN